MWEFWIDVGGTFTDCVARSPGGGMETFKTLSSGATAGRVEQVGGPQRIVDPLRKEDPENFWAGAAIRFADARGRFVEETRVASSSSDGRIELSGPVSHTIEPGCSYELRTGEPAPILAIRHVLGLSAAQPLPPVSVRLGTTRGTNALLERAGARTALVTTRGFADALLIGNQDRPRLFDLAIHKPEPLFRTVLEVDERVGANGEILLAPDESAVRRQLASLRDSGTVDSLAICLLHAYRFPDHEELIARIAQEVGFHDISRSSTVAPLIKFVSRGDTTVLDAYLQPVLRDYIAGIRAALMLTPAAEGQSLKGAGRSRRAACGEGVFPISTEPERHPPDEVSSAEELWSAGGPVIPAGRDQSSLKVMTSSGGLVDAERFSGVESILSGPAGGVVGFSRIAEQAGFKKAIGFDMGGTSTDVARYDGRFELQFETQKAGVRIMSPVLAIETVAAGGGSICRFDGIKLVVGPESAGADPGPACYGRGGPLTVTDVNLFLGRIPEDEFPFPLHRGAVEERLTALCEEIASSPTGHGYQPFELAAGFIEIANANMVRAIRRISVARGYDPAEHVLVPFGGAGGQHACAIARTLGIRQILIHPYAGILSAYGIGCADIRRHQERAVLERLTDESIATVESIFAELEAAALAELRWEDVPEDCIAAPQRSLDLRYEGVEAAINVPEPGDCDYRRVYEALHEQLYGYRRSGRPIEIVAARVELVGRTPVPPVEQHTPRRRRARPAASVTAWFSGSPQETGLYHRRDLHAGDEIPGPAIVCEPTSTVVIDPGFAATILPRGEILISDLEASAPNSIVSTSERPRRRTSAEGTRACGDPDPVRLEVFNNLFASIAEQMGVALQKTAVSTNVKERLDFSCALFDATGGLVVNAPHIPVHLGAMSETVRCVISDNPDMGPGDVFVTNDPYRGGSHLPDVTVVTPVHDAGGELLFLAASRAHHAEIGGVTPGSMPPFSSSLAEEGVLIRNFKLVDRGRSRMDELRRILTSGPYPSRRVEDNLADVAAQVAANQAGVRLLRELIEQQTLPVVRAYMRHIQLAAARKTRMAIAALPDGTRTFTDHLDDGSPIVVTITIAGDSATVDFTGTGPVLSSNLNANRAIVTAAVLYAFRCLIAEDIPLNGGVLEPIEIVLPPCLLNPPAHDDPGRCAAIVGGNVETSQRIVDVLLGALGVAAASQGTMNNLTFGDDTFGYYETLCGGSGATPDADGADAVHTHMTNTRLTDVEVIERRYPVRIEEFAIRRGSGGAGQHRGGDGVVRRIEFLAPLRVSLLTQRRGRFHPFGLAGGEAGAAGRNLLQRRGSPQPTELPGCTSVDVEPGDVLTIETPGGGGFFEVSRPSTG